MQMRTRPIVALLAIVFAWFAMDVVSHLWLLAPFYNANPALWRPLHDMSVALTTLARVVLAAIFVVMYQSLVHPKSLRAALWMGGLLGLALGTASGLGTFIHSPIPAPLAAGWFVLGTIKGLVAGAIIGLGGSSNIKN
jgi:hypothetical protein